MKSILVINAGSTSLKYVQLQADNLEAVKSDVIRDIGTKVASHNDAWQKMMGDLGDDLDLAAVGHRLVHGGTEFVEPTILNDEVLEKLAKYNELAPLHNPPGLACIKASFKNLGGDIPNIAVFDTAFYKDLPEIAYRYALPPEMMKKHDIRRFGFHGISHHSVSLQAAAKLQKDLSELNLITIHLGGGASMTATRKGTAVDTSMGFTPMEGLVMMTRSGDIDASIPLFLQEKEKMSASQIYDILNKKSGVCALAGIAEGMLEIEAAADQGNKDAEFAISHYVYHIRKYLGSYLAVLGKVDAIVFTGAIGFGSQKIRNLVTSDFPFLENIPVYHFEPQEEQLIAREIKKII